MRYTDAIKREGKSIGPWCRRYFGISRREVPRPRVRRVARPVAHQEGDDRRCDDAAQSDQDGRRAHVRLDLLAALITSGISSTQSTAMTSAAKRVAASRPYDSDRNPTPITGPPSPR